MKSTTKKSVSVASGVAAVATSVTGSVVGLAGAAEAVPAPVLSPTTCTLPSVAAKNAQLVAAYKAGKTYKALVTATGKAKTAWTTHKGTKAAYTKALGKQNAALAAFTRLNTYAVYTGVADQGTIASVTRNVNSVDEQWKFGSYTTRVLVQGIKVSAVCTSVNEAGAGKVGVFGGLSVGDATTSRDLYQGIDKPMSEAVPGQLPTLWFAAAFGHSGSKAGVTAHVVKCVTDDYNTISTVCPKGGLAIAPGGLTGATYTVNGFEQSLQKALTAAKTATRLTA